MKSFTRIIRAKMWSLKASKVSGEHASKARSEMQILDCRDLRHVVGGDEVDAPKGSWLASQAG